jgi:hypothetical protein
MSKSRVKALDLLSEEDGKNEEYPNDHGDDLKTIHEFYFFLIVNGCHFDSFDREVYIPHDDEDK